MQGNNQLKAYRLHIYGWEHVLKHGRHHSLFLLRTAEIIQHHLQQQRWSDFNDHHESSHLTRRQGERDGPFSQGS